MKLDIFVCTVKLLTCAVTIMFHVTLIILSSVNNLPIDSGTYITPTPNKVKSSICKHTPLMLAQVGMILAAPEAIAIKSQ